MSLFGVGMLELTVIFLIAFLVMGPAKAIEMAKTAGKLIADVKRSVNELTAAIDLNEQRRPASPPSNEPTSSSPAPPPTGAVPTNGTGEGNEQQS
ncbi:MAG: twin-arginine translocase TatA/TatE family subunit [Chloroflexota bacterium]|nr:twin-arginine translocase TatA/TatE family subunit [Chloroflexota bacterium]